MSNSENRASFNRRQALLLPATAGLGAALAQTAKASDSIKTAAHQAPGLCSTPRSAVAKTQYGKVRGYGTLPVPMDHFQEIAPAELLRSKPALHRGAGGPSLDPPGLPRTTPEKEQKPVIASSPVDAIPSSLTLPPYSIHISELVRNREGARIDANQLPGQTRYIPADLGAARRPDPWRRPDREAFVGCR